MSLPQTQRAWVIKRRGHPAKALVLRNDYPLPSKCTPGNVLIKIHAAALNPVGYKLMKLLPNFLAGRPLVAEHDFAGSVVNGNGTEFKEGDQVFGFIDVALARKSKQGTLAQYAVVPADRLIRRPENISPIEASGVALVAQTAYEGLNVAKLEPNMSLFINGGSTGVGLFAIQIAKAKGIKVTASASRKNEELVRRMGADEFVDYTKQPLHEYFTVNPPDPKFHAIFDAVGLRDPSLYTHSSAYLAPNGSYITTGPFPAHTTKQEVFHLLKTLVAIAWPAFLGGVKQKYLIINVKHRKEDMDDLRELIVQGKVQGVVDSVYSFGDVLQAYERMMTTRATGKIVVRVD